MNFALIGAAGYIAPRHMQAIRETGNNLIAVCDPSDSVGVIDRYFPGAKYFREPERMAAYLDVLTGDDRAQYISIATPNHLHAAHIRTALRLGADAICEKPLVVDPAEIDGLLALEAETGRRVYTVLQLRHHPEILRMRERFSTAQECGKYRIDLRYVTARGEWYDESWKGDSRRSGGLAANIGIHFFDMLIWIFGGVESSTVTESARGRMAGELELARARVSWMLSINGSDLPKSAVSAGKTMHRSMTVDGATADFSDGFADLHTDVYRGILSGSGYGISDAEQAIRVVSDMAIFRPLSTVLPG